MRLLVARRVSASRLRTEFNIEAKREGGYGGRDDYYSHSNTNPNATMSRTAFLNLIDHETTTEQRLDSRYLDELADMFALPN